MLGELCSVEIQASHLSAPFKRSQVSVFVRFEYEFHDDAGQWFRAYGNENWEFDELSYMKFRFASINDLPIKAADRKFRWERKA